ncbi:hypothetical protein ACFLT5_03815 [Chloroflexota bacterium]
MIVRHPFNWILEEAQNWVFASWSVLALVVMAALQVLGAPLQNPIAPLGIVSFEFAGTLARVQEILASWSTTGQIYAGLNLGLDYLFLVSYGAAIGLGCVLVARNLPQRLGRLRSLGIVLAWGLIAAALLDVLENYALIRLLLGAQSEQWPALAFWCAVPKFLLVGAGLAYIVAGAVAALFRRLFGRE